MKTNKSSFAIAPASSPWRQGYNLRGTGLFYSTHMPTTTKRQPKTTKAKATKRPSWEEYFDASMRYLLLYAKMERAAGIVPGSIMHGDVWGNVHGHCPTPHDENTPLGQAAAFAELVTQRGLTRKSAKELTAMFEPLCAATE